MAVLKRESQRGTTPGEREKHNLARFRAAIDASADLVLLVDRASLRYIDVNQAACRALGYEREELLKLGPPDVFSMSRQEFVQLYDRMFAGELPAPVARGAYRRKDGSLLAVEAFPRAVRAEDGDFVVTVARDISERIAAEAALRASEERFRSLTLLSSDWYWEQDEQFRFTFFSGPPMEQRTGITAESHLGKTRWELPAVNITPEGWQRHKAMLERHEPFYDFEISRFGPDGRRRWNLVSGTPVFDVGGKFAGYRGIGKDVTERKRAELVIRLGHTVTRVLAEAASAQEAVEGAIRAICEAQDWECGRYFCPDERSGVLRFGAAWGVAHEAVQRFIAGSRDIVFAPGVGLTGRVWQSGQPLWVADVAKDARTSQQTLSRLGGTHGAFVFPVLAEGKAAGVLAFSSRDVREPEARLLEAIGMIGSQIGQFLKRKQAEEAQREVEQRLRQTFELAGSGIAQVGLDLRYQRANRVLCRMLGYDAAELIGRSVKDFVHPDDRDLVDEASRRMRESGESIQFERRYLRKDGMTVWANVKVALVRDVEGRPQYQIAVYDDITERKRADRLLRLEHAVTRVLAGSDSVLGTIESVLRAVGGSEGWECGRYFELDESAGVLRFGTAWSVPQEDARRFIAGWRDVTYTPGVGLPGHAWRTGQPLWVADGDKDPRASRPQLGRETGMHGAFVFPILAAGKTVGVMAFNSRSVREPDERLLQAIGAIGSQIGQFLQRRRAEEVLRESEERFRSLFSLSSDWYWEQDEQLRFTFISGSADDRQVRGAGSYLGKTRWELPSDNLTAEDWARHKEVLARREAFHDLELSRVSPDGKRRWNIISGMPIFDATGAFKGYRGVGKDITERKRADLRREIEHEVTRMLSESATLGTAVREILRLLCERLNWACGARWSVGEDGMLRRNESWGIDDPAVAAFLSETRTMVRHSGPQGLIGHVFSGGTAVQFADVTRRKDFARAALAERAGLHAALALPLAIESKVFGAIEFFRREVSVADAWVVETMLRAGNQIAQSMARRQAEAAARKTQELARSNVELEQFAYVASHDLQEPLRMISSYTQLLMRRTEGKLDQDARDFAAFIVDGAARMKQLIEDLLAYSRVGSRGRAFRPTDCSLVLRQVLANLRLAIEQTGVTVTHDLLPTLQADDSQIAQLLQNLVGNAIKFRGVEAPRVHVSAEERDDAWVLSVRDNGIGIEPQYFERIFTMFQRLHGKTEYPGTGIGLAICRRVVERHGGHIQVESTPGSGSTFHCALPKRRDAESEYADADAR